MHPQGKRGGNISRRKYETIRDAIDASLRGSAGMTYTELVAEVSQRVGGSFEGSVKWYVVAVKQDMEARELLGRVPGTRLQLMRLVNGVSSAGAVASRHRTWTGWCPGGRFSIPLRRHRLLSCTPALPHTAFRGAGAGAVGCLSTPRPRSPGVFTHRVIAASAASLCGDS